VEQVVATVHGTSDRLDVTITWTGGSPTHHRTARRVKRYEQLEDFEKLLARVRELHAAGRTCEAIAERLNAEGFHAPYATRIFSKKNVGRLLRKYFPSNCHRRSSLRESLQSDEWLPNELARRVGIGKTTIHRWIEFGWVRHRIIPHGHRRLHACWADAAELARLTKLAKTPRHWYDPPLPGRLTTPGPTPKTTPPPR
jgi:hypothetical protein